MQVHKFDSFRYFLVQLQHRLLVLDVVGQQVAPQAQLIQCLAILLLHHLHFIYTYLFALLSCSDDIHFNRTLLQRWIDLFHAVKNNVNLLSFFVDLFEHVHATNCSLLQQVWHLQFDQDVLLVVVALLPLLVLFPPLLHRCAHICRIVDADKFFLIIQLINLIIHTWNGCKTGITRPILLLKLLFYDNVIFYCEIVDSFYEWHFCLLRTDYIRQNHVQFFVDVLEGVRLTPGIMQLRLIICR